ncbi:MAG TPA: heme-binding beta-barrel domain-containing protein [Bryobacteraceae bacterium]|nr:heme-binding beta-barrel domain-containing protein [Bryobacteraceae bacterium]
MKRLVPSIAMLIAFSAMAQSDPWAALRPFEGKWKGPTSGKPGKGSTFREFQFVLNGRFLSQRDTSMYQPEDPAAKQVIHEDFGFFSYDTGAQKIVWRQFHSEGMVNEYTLDSVSADGKSLEFVTTKIENLPPGYRAKKRYQILSADEIVETFWLAPAGKDLEVYTVAHLKRVK